MAGLNMSEKEKGRSIAEALEESVTDIFQSMLKDVLNNFAET